MSISIVDVSKKAGVSRMTVSRVINGNGYVSEQTQKNVLSVIRELGYFPSRAARAMRSQHSILKNSDSVCCGLIFGVEDEVGEDYFYNVAHSVEHEMIEQGLSLVQCHWQQSFEDSWKRINSLLSVTGLCGIILAGSFLHDDILMIQKKIDNIVIIGGPAPIGTDIHSVEVDYLAGGKMAFDLLYKQGCRRVLVLSGPWQDHYFSEAIQGASVLYKDHFEQLDVFHTQLTAKCGYEIVHEKYANPIPYDAIFTNDQAALGAMQALHKKGVKIPQDVKIIGFDDVYYASYLTPSLTTIRVDNRLLGQEAIKILIENVGSMERKSNRFKRVLKTELIIRETA